MLSILTVVCLVFIGISVGERVSPPGRYYFVGEVKTSCDYCIARVYSETEGLEWTSGQLDLSVLDCPTLFGQSQQ